eukprot:4596468-Amphidinium_carterae.1
MELCPFADSFIECHKVCAVCNSAFALAAPNLKYMRSHVKHVRSTSPTNFNVLCHAARSKSHTSV